MKVVIYLTAVLRPFSQFQSTILKNITVTFVDKKIIQFIILHFPHVRPFLLPGEADPTIFHIKDLNVE